MNKNKKPLWTEEELKEHERITKKAYEILKSLQEYKKQKEENKNE